MHFRTRKRAASKQLLKPRRQPDGSLRKLGLSSWVGYCLKMGRKRNGGIWNEAEESRRE